MSFFLELIKNFYCINWSALWIFPPLRKTVSTQVKNYNNFSRVVEIANKLLTRHSFCLAPGMNRPLSKIRQYSLLVPPKFCINIVSIFSWDLLWSHEKNESNTYAKLWRDEQEYYGVF